MPGTPCRVKDNPADVSCTLIDNMPPHPSTGPNTTLSCMPRPPPPGRRRPRWSLRMWAAALAG